MPSLLRVHTAPQPIPVTRTEFVRHEVFSPFIHTCCLNRDGCEAAQVQWSTRPGHSPPVRSGTVPLKFRFCGSIRQLGRVGKPIRIHSRFRRTEKGAGPSYSAKRYSFLNLTLVAFGLTPVLTFASGTRPHVPSVDMSTLPPPSEQCVDSTYLRPLSIHPRTKFILVPVTSLLL